MSDDVVQVNGKEVNLSALGPSKMRDQVELDKKGATIQALQTQTIEPMLVWLHHFLAKANPEVTLDDVYELKSDEFSELAEKVQRRLTDADSAINPI